MPVLIIKLKHEVVKRLRSSSIPEFKATGNKIRFEANNKILEKIDQAISSIEKVNMEKCQEMLHNGKKLLLKQHKLLRIADTEEDCWEVVKCCLPDDLVSNLDVVRQLLRARRKQLLIRKNERVLSKNIERNRSGMSPYYRKSFEFLGTSSSSRIYQHG